MTYEYCHYYSIDTPMGERICGYAPKIRDISPQSRNMRKIGVFQMLRLLPFCDKLRDFTLNFVKIVQVAVKILRKICYNNGCSAF